MHVFRIVLFVFVFLATNFTLLAQTTSFKINGKILNETQQAIADATVSLVNSENKEVAKTVSTTNGLFELSFNVKGVYNLIIKHTGFTTYKVAFELANKDFDIIYLVSTSQTLDEVVVQSKQNLIEVDANSITYNVAKSITAQGGNALDALKNARGYLLTTIIQLP